MQGEVSSGTIEHSFSEELSITNRDPFDFDFPDDWSIRSDVILDGPVNWTDKFECSWENETIGKRVPIVRSASKKRCSKFMHKIPMVALRSMKPVSTSVGTRCLKPNMSRRTRDTMLYAFPSFDRCDSLLFFPSTLARHLNSGDIPAIAKLFLTHFDKNCSFCTPNATSQSGMTLQSLVRKYEILGDLLPDRITCIHSTQVVGNQIRALSFSKFTNCRAIYDSLAGTMRGTEFSGIFKHSWSDHLRYKIGKEQYTAEEREKHLALVEIGCDLLVYTRMEFVLTIDDVTKKVTNLCVDMRTTAIHEAKHSSE